MGTEELESVESEDKITVESKMATEEKSMRFYWVTIKLFLQLAIGSLEEVGNYISLINERTVQLEVSNKMRTM